MLDSGRQGGRGGAATDAYAGYAGAALLNKASRAMAWNAVLTPVAAIVSLICSVVLVRTLSEEAYATYAMVTSGVATMVVWGDMGVTSALPKLYAELVAGGQSIGSSWFWRLISIRLVQAAFLAVCILLGAEFLVGESQLAAGRWLLWIVWGISMLQLVSAIFAQVLAAFFDRLNLTVATLASSVFKASALIMAAVLIGRLGAVVGALAVAALFATFVNALFARQALARIPKAATIGAGAPTGGRWAALARTAAVMHVDKIGKYFVSPEFGILVAGAMLATRDVAALAVGAWLAARVFAALYAPLNGVVVPLFAHARANGDRRDTRVAYSGVARLMATLLLPVAGLQVVLAPDLIGVLYSSAYRNAAVLFAWMSSLMIVEAILSAPAWTLLTVHERLGPGILGGGLKLLAVPLAYLAAGTESALGLVIALRVASVPSIIYALRYTDGRLGVSFPFGYVIRIALLTAAAGAAAWVGLLPLEQPIARLVVGTLVFGLVWYASWRVAGGPHPEDRALLAASGLPGRELLLRWL